MLGYDSSIHRTITHRIDPYCWEFVCSLCGYRARYTSTSSGSQDLEIVNIGNPRARHVSQDWPVVQQAKPHPAPVLIAENEDNEDWLTPELCQQMENLLKDVDMGDWDTSS